MENTKKITAAIVGFGNIGRNIQDAIRSSDDFELKAIVEYQDIAADSGIVVLKDFNELSGVDVAFITTPSRTMPTVVPSLLRKGINCVDCFDVHTDIIAVRSKFDAVAKETNTVSVTAAGWDPGSDSVVRCLLQAIAPKGLTYTNFGPGVSMGHTVCAKSKKGVKDALSITVSKGEGLHRRMVYVELEKGADFDEVAALIKSDDYFKHDETHVIETESIESIRDLGHGVKITRKAKSANAFNQLFSFEMRINNPALTAEILTACARAAMRQKPGCYTMIEIPPVDFIAKDRESAIRSLV